MNGFALPELTSGPHYGGVVSVFSPILSGLEYIPCVSKGLWLISLDDGFWADHT